MVDVKRHFVYRNIANATSILGVLPLVFLLLDDGYRYLIPLIIYNNIMDDLDGVLAAKLNIRSRFGANLDNVCDAVAHVALVFAVAAHFGGLVMVASMVACASIILRATSRLDPDVMASGGSPTNELMRHMLFILLVTMVFNIDPEYYLIPMFLIHAITMNAPFKLPILIRGLASTVMWVVLVNVALVVAWLVPTVSPVVAAVFIATYLYSFLVGGGRWFMQRRTQIDG